MALSAIIFDLDGTLLDTNPIHIEAWRRAFERHGFPVAPDRIGPEIASESPLMIASILGQSVADEVGEKISESLPEFIAQVVHENKPLRVMNGTRELFAALKERHIKIAIATTASEKELDVLIEGSGFDVRALADVVMTKEDAENGKPAPDILWAACEKLGFNPAQCALVGDSKWDSLSAREAGIVAIGVLEGSVLDEETLSRVGMRIVFPTISELLKNLDAVLEKCSPGVLRLTKDVQEKLMREAMQAARDGVRDGGVPIGCVLARPTSDPTNNRTFEIVARGFNQGHRTGDKTAHAEIVTFRDAAGKIPTDADDVILVSTLEPCVMCLGACMEAAVDTVIYGLRAPADNGTSRVAAPQSPQTLMPRIVGGVLSDDCRALFEDWLKQNESSEQAAFVRQLLESTN